MLRNVRLVVVSSAIFLTTGQNDRATAETRHKINIARGKIASFDPAPNYALCTDPQDKLQLTDGVAGQCRWRDRETVGWNAIAVPKGVVLIDLDLGEEHPIGEIAINTISGAGSDVTFPAAALVYTSQDGKNYRYLCDVVNEHIGDDGLHTFRATELKGWGRYVRLAIVCGGFYFFCDEIEIIKGNHKESQLQPPGDEHMLPADRVKAAAVASMPQITQKKATLSLLSEARSAIGQRRSLVSETETNNALDLIQSQRHKVLTASNAEPADYGQGPPYRQYDRAAFAAVGRLNSLIWPGKDFIVWRNDDWSWLRPLQSPQVGTMAAGISTENNVDIRVEMMNNEWATASFVITSASDEPQELSFLASAFEGPTQIDSKDVLNIAHAVHVEANGFQYRDDAIVPLAEGSVVLAPGCNKRVWLTFKTRGCDYPSGTYKSTLTLANSSGQKSQIPVSLKIWPIRFPDKTSLHSVGWGYFNRKPIVGMEEQAVQNLIDHYNTTQVLTHNYIPYPKVDADGNFLEPLDFSNLDRMLEWNPQTRMWLLWAGFEFGHQRLGTAAYGTKLWEKVFRQWVTQIRDHLLSKGVSRDQFAWYWIDEPHPDRWDTYVVRCSKLLKLIDPEMLVWANPVGVPADQIEDSLSCVDIVCPELHRLRPSQALQDVVHRSHRPSWAYVCAGHKGQDPLSYYRLHSWNAWELRLGGIGMWVYVDDNAMTLSDYAPSVSYSMVYRGRNGIINSKRLEAWRQGIADYEYLRMLDEACRQATDRDVASKSKARAKEILDHDVQLVLKSGDHGVGAERARNPDDLRLEMLSLITELHRKSRLTKQGP